MAIDRRRFLQLLMAGPLILPVPASSSAEVTRLLSCRSDTAGRHFATLFDTGGAILFDAPLPARGHGIALSPDKRLAAVMARRPGDFLVLLDIVDRRAQHQLRTPEGRHCLGHAVFSTDGQRLFTTENAFDEDRGVIGIYDVGKKIERIGELDSHGIGPHELHWLSDGRTLAVANGGILTHPDMPRAKLNLDAMRSNLAYIDSTSGELLQRFETPDRWQKLSIRHLDVSPDDDIAMVMQYEGPRNDRPPLVAVQRGEHEPDWLQAPDSVQQQMRNYCGSVAFAHAGSEFAVTSPRGGIVTRWRRDGRFIDATRQVDVCGVAATAGGFWFSDGVGNLTQAQPGLTPNSDTAFNDSRWDNHLTPLG